MTGLLSNKFSMLSHPESIKPLSDFGIPIRDMKALCLNISGELPDYEETVALSEGKRTGFPDWRHPELQRFHKEFYQKFAERYDNDPRLAFLQTGFGLWAEYHIYDGPRIMGQTFPSKEFQAEFFRFMSETFKSTPWSVSIDAASSEYTPLEADASLRNLKFGVFDDSFMHETHDEYNGKNWKILGEKRYQTSPAGGEFGYYTKYDQEHVLDYPDGIHGRNFEGESKRFHITYMIGNNQPSYQTMNRIKQASMLCKPLVIWRCFSLSFGSLLPGNLAVI